MYYLSIMFVQYIWEYFVFCFDRLVYRDRPQFSEKGGGRLLQKALLGLGRKRSSRDVEFDDDEHVPPTKLRGIVY